MKKHPQNKVEEKVNNVDKQKNENELKSKGFFKTIWYSIDKIEKYPELAAEGFIKAIRYLVKLIAILAIIISAVSVYKSSAEFKEIAQYIDEKAPNFTYKDNVLTSEEAEDVIRNESEEFGKVIIDLKVTDENQIEAYVNEIGNEESGMVILNNQLIIKQGTQGNIRYSYEDLLKQMGVTEFNKQQLVDYLSGTAMMNIYLGLFVSLFIYSFVIYFINTLIKEGRNRMSGLEKKFATKSKIVNYIINRESTSKVEISKELNLSMPTVLSNVKDLLEKGIIIETGEYESTGGRKAKSIGINPSYRYAMGIVITANHLGMVLVNLKYEIVKSERIRLKFVSDMSYCSQVADFAAKFLDHMNDAEQKEKLLGVGISIPGIINQEQKLVIKSHALKLENYSLSFLEQAFSVPVYFSNDANAAMMAEDMNIYQNAIYLSLNQTLGGAFCIGGNLFSGENQKAGEFGHMILVPQGRKCYCGKSGCADAYCAAGALVGESKDSVEQFMQLLQNNDEKAEKKWEEYLDYLAVLISNLRMAYDMDIILGGEMGGYLSDYMIPLGEKVMKYNGFDHDLRYLKNCSYKKEASAVGAAKHFLQDFIGKI